ncbi:hypothetical protein [Enterobacter quasiroggenkampii]|uniref:hypothetical protein n=1 Tax=Enterobacter quasiroggenkampii TaxID=2497436 RepID=UPI001F1E9500|nr:hypothetical protein [Enterobacter quasiroggenkampii]
MARFKIFLFGIVIIVLSTALYFSIQHNSYNVVLSGIFYNYQRESESLVLSDMYAQKHDLNTKGWRLGYIAPEETSVPDILYPYNHFEQGDNAKVKFIPYVSQFGIQSVFFSGLANFFNAESIQQIRSINSILFTLTIAALVILYARLFNPYFAAIFLAVFVISPWIVPISRNLYWMPFTWFLPAIFSAIYFLSALKKARYLCLLMIFLSFALKCMAGYEYITSITLLTCAPVFLLPFFNKNIEKYSIRDFLLIFGVCVLAFAAVLLIHSGMRGNGILDGLKNIYEYDVKRRTYGDAHDFNNIEIQKSLNATVWTVLREYFANWSTDVVKYLPGEIFPWLIGIVFALCGFSRNWKALVAFIYALSIPLSWYILAKSHSEVHVFINFVLWYMLFIPLMFYYIGYFGVRLFNMLKSRIN